MTDQERLEKQLANAERKVRLALLEALRRIKNEYTLKQLTTLIENGQIEDAYRAVDKYMDWFAKQVTIQYVIAGQATAEFISSAMGIVVSFDQVNTFAVQAMQNNQLRILSDMSYQQRTAIRNILVDGVTRGINPRQQAEMFKQYVGLSAQQVQYVANYRKLLESGNATALDRALRDRRFDGTIQSAVREQKPLTKVQIDRMVQRYTERAIAYRATTIARTEALSAVNEGNNAMFAQAIESGALVATDLIDQWFTAQDEKVRSSHSPMHKQKRRHGEPFLSGAGNLLRYPGDTAAPAKERIRCRCVKTTRLSIKGVS